MIVVDSNLLACLVIPGAFTQEAERIRTRDRDWTAPALIRLELMNVIVKECRENRMTRDGALRTLRRGMNVVSISKLTSDPLFIFNLAQSTGCTVYDLEFVWLAMEMGVPLVTADKQVLAAFPSVAVDFAAFA